MNYQNLVLGTLSNDAFVQVNKKLAQNIGFMESALLGETLSIYRMCKKENTFYKKVEGEWFYITQPYIEKMLGIKRTQFDTAMKNLVKENILSKKRLDLPAKNFYMINWEKIAEMLSQNSSENSPEVTEKSYEPLESSDWRKPANKDGENQQTSVEKTSNQEWRKSAPIITTNKNKEIKTNNNTSSSEIRDFIDSELKEQYPNKPFEEIKAELLNDNTATITTDKQYKSMLEYRLTNWNPKQPKKQSSRKKPVRTEIIPEHMEEGYTAPKPEGDPEEKKREIEEMLQKLRS